MAAWVCLAAAAVPMTAVTRKEASVVPLPTSAQIAWQEAELVAVFHYDLHVFDGKLYNQAENRITPIPDANIFHPNQLDTDQWIRSVKAMGAKIAILTATHETGFALYQSDVNPYCMKALKWKDGKGDIVADFVASCRRHGIRPGIYIGIRWNSFFGIHDFLVPQDGSRFQNNRQVFYNKMCEGMTEELMSRYGELAIVWYDGGGHGPELGGPDILPIVEKYQQDIIGIKGVFPLLDPQGYASALAEKAATHCDAYGEPYRAFHGSTERSIPGISRISNVRSIPGRAEIVYHTELLI